MRRRGRGTVAEALESALGNLDSATKVRESMALGYWERVVGPQAAAATEPESVREGVLFVRTKSAVWSQELTFLKARILAELNRRIGRPVIKDLVFHAQGVTKDAPRETPPRLPDEAEIAAVRLPPEEHAALRERLESLIAIPDGALRQAIARRMIRACQIRRWRLEHGWRVCQTCSAVHCDEGELCPICRVCR